jgi:ethanolamine utilization protein EutA
MESMLAAYGSGASKVSYDGDRRLLNIDIGGGTTKLAVLDKGNVIATAALHIGGRLHVVDDIGRLVRLDPAGKFHAREAGFHWNRGDVLSPSQLDRVAGNMADLLIAALTQRPLPHAIEHLYLTDPIADLGRIDGVMFSGGVGEYVYGREDRDFGDIGRRLGGAIRRRIETGALPWPLLPAGECIRATALGASEYSVQLSGNTSYISQPRELLPRRNLQVLQPSYDGGEVIDPAGLAKAIRAHFTAFDLIEGEGEVAVALRWTGSPSYERISAFAQGIRHGLATTIERKKPLYIMLDGDIAQTLGAILREELLVESEILAIDGVVLRDFDYIDLGRIRMPSYTVPVTIKSLLFSEDPRRGRPPQRIHHHEHDHHHDDHEQHHHGHPHDHHGQDEHGQDEHGQGEHGQGEHGQGEHGQGEHGQDDQRYHHHGHHHHHDHD